MGNKYNYNAVMKDVSELFFAANEQLKEITKGGFPFTYDEVELSVKTDAAGIYIHSGNTPVCAVALAGKPEWVIRDVRDGIVDVVESTKIAIARRSHIKNDMKDLEADSYKKEKAAEVLREAGLIDLIGDFNPEAANEIVKAAKKAVIEANKGLFNSVGLFMKRNEAKMSVKMLKGGIVILAGGKPCIVTRFPKVFNAKSIARMINFITSDVHALNNSRMRYFARIRSIAETEERLHEISNRLENAHSELAVAM